MVVLSGAMRLRETERKRGGCDACVLVGATLCLREAVVALTIEWGASPPHPPMGRETMLLRKEGRVKGAASYWTRTGYERGKYSRALNTNVIYVSAPDAVRETPTPNFASHFVSSATT